MNSKSFQPGSEPWFEPEPGGTDKSGNEHGHGTLILDSRSVIRYGDARAAHLFELPQSDLAGRRVDSLIPELDPRRCLRPASRPMRGTRPADADGQWHRFRAVSPSGRNFDLDVSLASLHLARMRPVLVGLRDPAGHHLSARGDMERLVRSLDAREELGLVTDRQGVILHANPAAEALTGYSVPELVGQPLAMLAAGLEEDACQRSLNQGCQFSGMLSNRKKDGEIYRQETEIRPFLGRDGRVTHFVLTGRDISHQLQSLERLEYLAYHDYLTGLANRALFLDRLSQARAHAARSGTRFAVLYLDLDHFKAINDEFGHGAGDTLLRSLADGLKAAVREEDTVARMGGDEFACLLQGVAVDGSLPMICDKIRASIRTQTAALHGADLPVTVSIGVAVYPIDAEDEAQLMHQADQAMYDAKSGGGDQFRCAEALSAQVTAAEGGRVLRWHSAKWR